MSNLKKIVGICWQKRVTITRNVKSYAHSEIVTEVVTTKKHKGIRLECGHAIDLNSTKKIEGKRLCLMCKYPGEFDEAYPKNWEYKGIMGVIYDWVDEA